MPDGDYIHIGSLPAELRFKCRIKEIQGSSTRKISIGKGKKKTTTILTSPVSSYQETLDAGYNFMQVKESFGEIK